MTDLTWLLDWRRRLAQFRQTTVSPRLRDEAARIERACESAARLAALLAAPPEHGHERKLPSLRWLSEHVAASVRQQGFADLARNSSPLSTITSTSGDQRSR